MACLPASQQVEHTGEEVYSLYCWITLWCSSSQLLRYKPLQSSRPSNHHDKIYTRIFLT
ncbi:unnamed protein product [Cyberlindnera jadinii]|uniref:Uncharacterized protein n=1 Tax=Cyberlindnera jadinii (strain ATCC 18201 / CBS 1600 / BCRC 20928 / JCM 3617 / NBRC 0987 / NRRL Y-1542) TaxID=983966 RepID=A0A0H5C8I0_CYBJN|nr:unnamed protein product [Cyberlindnera jadinii]